MAAPILVLVVCLPLLRPLRQPTQISENESGRLATIQAIVEHKTTAIDQSSFHPVHDVIVSAHPPGGPRSPRHFSKQPPVMAAMLAGPYWLLHRFGVTFDSNPSLAAYLLTLLGATLPVAAAAGLLYRMGRLFELPRPWRMTLAIAGTFGSGLVSYATVLNSHAPAAALVLGACVCLFHAGLDGRGAGGYGRLLLAGFCAALAGVIDLAALAFLVLLIPVILSLRWKMSARALGLTLYLAGAAFPIALHALLTVPITGDIRPGFLHSELAAIGHVQPPVEADDSDGDAPSAAGQMARHLTDGILGPHGLLSHFPILLVGLGGIGIVLHRHWPASVKTLAAACLGGAAVIVLTYVILDPDWAQPMFSVRWFIVFLPLIVFWAGVWLRKKHHPASWAAAAVVLGFSILTTLLGATAPFTPAANGEYTASAAARQLLHPNAADTTASQARETLLPPYPKKPAAPWPVVDNR
jgi:hypothetical protein